MLQKKIIQTEENVLKYPFNNHPIENQLARIFKLWERTQNPNNNIPEKKQIYWARGFLECFNDTPRGINIICSNVFKDPVYFQTTQKDFANFIKWFADKLAQPLHIDRTEFLTFPPVQLIDALKKYGNIIEDCSKPSKPRLAPVIFIRSDTRDNPEDIKTKQDTSAYRGAFMKI